MQPMVNFGCQGRSIYLQPTKPKSSLLHNLKSVPLALTGDTTAHLAALANPLSKGFSHYPSHRALFCSSCWFFYANRCINRQHDWLGCARRLSTNTGSIYLRIKALGLRIKINFWPTITQQFHIWKAMFHTSLCRRIGSPAIKRSRRRNRWFHLLRATTAALCRHNPAAGTLRAAPPQTGRDNERHFLSIIRFLSEGDACRIYGRAIEADH